VKSVDFADRCEDAFSRLKSRGKLGVVLFHLGRNQEAGFIFSRLRKAQTEFRKLGEAQMFLGPWYLEYFLDQGEYKEVLNWVRQTPTWIRQNSPPKDLAFDLLALGRSCLRQSLTEKHENFDQAEIHINEAVNRLRHCRLHHHLPIALLARAELNRVLYHYTGARRDLDEAFTIATRGGMRLHEADCYLECARLHLNTGEKDKAQENWAKAKSLIQEMSYHRRDPEIHLMEAQLHLNSGERNKARESLTTAKELFNKLDMHRWDYEVKKLETAVGR
jgi:tetratricopeptide (TPR) repeat protein